MARVDLKRYATSAEIQTNWMPRTLGSMSLRCGLGYVDGIYNDQKSFHIPFIFSASDTAMIEVTDQAMRVRISDVVVTRPSVSTSITNGTFDTDLTGWTDGDDTGGISSWHSSGAMALIGNGYSRAIRSQAVTVAAPDKNVEHAIRVIVNQGYVSLRIGTTIGTDNYFNATLTEGEHSLAFTPSGDFVIQVSSVTKYSTLIDSITVESAGEMVIPTPWVEADLSLLRYDQSGDVVFIACDSSDHIGYQQMKIERRSSRSWGVVKYWSDDGPFMIQNTDKSITMTPSAQDGDIILASSIPFFRSAHVGSLFSLTSIGQSVVASLSGGNQFSDPVKVTGVGTQRAFNYSITGTWVGTITLQRSVGDVGAWVDVTTFTSNAATSYNDALDNQIIYYRFGFKTGAYTSGTAGISMTYTSGSIRGIARVTSFNSNVSVTAIVLKSLGGTTGSDIWQEGLWSADNGFPTTPSLNEGRLWWFGRDKILGSVSDAYASFDETVEGDSGPINRSIGSGPVDRINWAVPLQRFAIGGESAEHFIFSSSLDEPITPTNMNIRAPSTVGSAPVQAIKLNNEAIFVDSGGTRLYTVKYENLYQAYANEDLTVFYPEFGLPGIKKIVVQKKPDTRAHCLRTDGTVGVLIYDKTEEVTCLINLETDGVVDDIVVLPNAPGEVEDKVYYAVSRTIGGVTKRFLEKFSLESECIGGTLNKQADSFVTFTPVSPTTTFSGLGHLEGCEVVLWVDGTDQSPTDPDGVQTLYTVTGGSITSPVTINTGAVAGLPYSAPYKGTKLAYAAALGTALNQMKTTPIFGLTLLNTHCKGLRYGRSLAASDLYDLPEVEDGAVVADNTIYEQYDNDMIEFPSDWSTDERVCLFAQAPRNVTVTGLVINQITNDST